MKRDLSVLANQIHMYQSGLPSSVIEDYIFSDLFWLAYFNFVNQDSKS